MKKDGKYRFTLQFGADNDEQIRVGELLENLGNRKSAVIVSALSDYLNAHPELQSGNSKIEVKVTSTFNHEQITQLIKTGVEEKLYELHITGNMVDDASISGTSEAMEEDIAMMLENLEVFN